MKYRLAKPSDSMDIANIHFNVRNTYDIGIFAMLGKSFLYNYYKIILDERNEVVLCAEDDNDKLQGFCSATLDVEKQFEKLRKHKVRLGFAAIGSIMRKPLLIRLLIDRYKSTTRTGDTKFVSSSGVRLEYWAWSGTAKESVSSLEMHEILLKVLADLGVKDVFFEVDIVNKRIFLFHKHNGAELLDKIILPDGRERALMKYDLINRISALRR